MGRTLSIEEMNKQTKKQFAFTLIELLVVIAIIGILSALIVVGMSLTTEKANIAKSQVFSNSLRNSLLSNLVSEWGLDGNAGDSWSGGNNGNWYGAGGGTNLVANYRPVAECISGQCLNFDGTDDYLSMPDSSSLDIVENISFEMWVYPYNATAGYTFLLRKETPGYDLSLSPNGKLQFYIFHYFDTAWRTSSCISNASLVSNKFYHIAVTFYKNNYLKIYINGRLDNQSVPSFDYGTGTNNNSLVMGYPGWWGGTPDPNRYFSGIIDEVRLYNVVMPAFEIKQNYFVGLNKLLSMGSISQAEYNQRFAELSASFAKK